MSLPLLNSTEVLIIYGGVCCLLYVEADGFHRETPFMNIMPMLSLTILALTLRVKKTTKLFTSLTFLVFALAVYLHSSKWRNNLQSVYGAFTIAHILYILSFILSIRRLWFACAVMVIIYVSTFLHFCFVDLFWSIPILVLNLSLHFIVLAISLIAAGSIWYYGSDIKENRQKDALLRFLGLLSFMACDSLLILDRFGSHINGFNYLCTALFYIGQPLLFVANQQAF
ncbi:YhhN-like family protein [Acanthocheilonema viteae]